MRSFTVIDNPREAHLLGARNWARRGPNVTLAGFTSFQFAHHRLNGLWWV